MADDLIQLLIDENPYGAANAADLTSGIADVTAQLTAHRGKTELKDLSSIDGPSAKAKKDSPAKIADTYEQFMEGLFWHFKGEQIRVSKALRLEYKVNNRDYYILIGFEGSGDGM
jgi:hypothetical protein